MPINAIILAAGEGTRMKSAHPKVTHKLLEKPLIWWPVHAAREAGCERIIVVIGHGAQEVRDALADEQGIEFVEQAERLGTGHAMMCVRNALGACTVLTFEPDDATGYGRVLRGDDGGIEAIIEHKDCTPEQRDELLECNSGIYCFCGSRLTANIDRIGNDNVQGEYYLTDMVGIYKELGEPVAALLAEDPDELLGVNSRIQLAQATYVMQDRINARLMDEGVTMLDPALVWVGPEASVGRDTVLMPMTMLWGATSIGEGCTVGPNTRLTDVTVADGCSIEETVGYSTVIDEGVTVGPRAYLRPGTHLCARAHVGTHVEIKNSTIGEGSKVPHLSYIGDTTMGSGVNIGAGSITCNYDGVFKHKTVIGNDVFIGYDTMRVAPVEIGDGALVGASSCITQDVPAGALALERSEQQMIEGYATQRMQQLKKQKERLNKKENR